MWTSRPIVLNFNSPSHGRLLPLNLISGILFESYLPLNLIRPNPSSPLPLCTTSQASLYACLKVTSIRFHFSFSFCKTKSSQTAFKFVMFLCDSFASYDPIPHQHLQTRTTVSSLLLHDTTQP